MARRRIVRPARASARREKRGARYARLLGQRLQFAIARMLLTRARRRVVGHQQFDERATRASTRSRIRGHRHPVFGGPHARSGENPRAHVHHANAADAHGIFVLLMAQAWEWRCRSCAPHRTPWCPLARCNFAAVDREFDQLRAALMPASPPHSRARTFAAPAKQMPDGHSRRVMCASTSSRKYFSTEAIGTGTTCPSPQIEVSRMRLGKFVEQAPYRSEDARPCVQPASISTIFCEPTRQGTHLPHDSLRKNRMALAPCPACKRLRRIPPCARAEHRARIAPAT